MNRLGPLALVVFVWGCNPADDQIRTYTVPKTTTTPATLERVEPPTAGTPVRTLGVIVPVGNDRSRFVKLNAAATRVDAVEASFRAFAQSLVITDTPEKTLEFKLPEGWVAAPARMMRQATFQAGAPSERVEVYISDAFGGDVLGNVNRWRQEVGLPEVGIEQLPESSKPLVGGPPNAVFVDLRGVAPAGGNRMGGPFQSGKR